MDDEKPLDLRDKLAMEVLNGLLSSGKDQSDVFMSNITYYLHNPDYEKGTSLEIEKTIRSCYKVADIIRKVRLTAFE